jgi:hypothetical protein
MIRAGPAAFFTGRTMKWWRILDALGLGAVLTKLLDICG